MALQTPQQRSGNVVSPGERLGVIEEFIPDAGTYVKDGVIYSKILGCANMDRMTHKVSVQPIKDPTTMVPKPGTIVLGQVGNAQSDNVLVRIFAVGARKKMSGNFGGVLHVSDASDRYVDNLSDAMKPGDVIRARVVSEKNQTFHLSTADRNLGVLHAFCSLCSGAMELKRPGEVQCTKCGHIEHRRTTPDYGKDSV